MIWGTTKSSLIVQIIIRSKRKTHFPATIDFEMMEIETAAAEQSTIYSRRGQRRTRSSSSTIFFLFSFFRWRGKRFPRYRQAKDKTPTNARRSMGQKRRRRERCLYFLFEPLMPIPNSSFISPLRKRFSPSLCDSSTSLEFSVDFDLS